MEQAVIDIRAYFAPPDPDTAISCEGYVKEDLDLVAQHLSDFKPLPKLPAKASFDAARLMAAACKETKAVKAVDELFMEAFVNELRGQSDQAIHEAVRGHLLPTLKLVDGTLYVDVMEYLAASSSFPPQFTLRYRPIQNGFVPLARDHLGHLLQSALQAKYGMQGLRRVPAWIRDAYKEQIRSIDKYYGAIKRNQERIRQLGDQPQHYPPCIAKWMHILDEGGFLDHKERFNLVGFLHHFGKDTESIQAMFAKGPNYNPRKTRYQIEHITSDDATRGQGHGYVTDSCASLRDRGLCPSLSCNGKTPIYKYADNVRWAKKSASSKQWLGTRKATTSRGAAGRDTPPRVYEDEEATAP